MNAEKKSSSRLILLLSAWVMAVGLTACTQVGPDYTPPAPEMPVRWDEATGAIRSGPEAALQHWWTLFQDPVLDALIARAAVANPDLLIAETRIREARAQHRITVATGLPSLGIGGSVTHSRRSEHVSSSSDTRSQDLFQADWDAGWEIDLFGGTRRQIEAAEAALAATGEDRRDVLVSLEAEVARNYLELRTAQQRRTIALDTLRSREQTLELVRGKYRLGLGGQLETVQSEASLALTKAEIPALETTAIQARHRLALLLGQQPQTLKTELTTAANLPPVPPQLPAILPSDLLRQRPDIRSAERQLAAATATVGAATADLFPRFSLSALIGLQSTSLSDLVSRSSRFWSAGPTIHWPLFDGGQARALVVISEAQRDRARAIYKKSVLTALTEAEDALVALDRERKTRALLQKAVHSSRQALEIARGQYTVGLTPFLNVLQSENTVFESLDKLALSNQRLALAMIALYKALGGGWQAEAEAPDTSRPDVESPLTQHARNLR